MDRENTAVKPTPSCQPQDGWLAGVFVCTYRFLAPRRLLTAALVAVLVAVSFYRAAGMSAEEDVTAFLPAGNHVVEGFRKLVVAFRHQDRMFFDIGLDEDSEGTSHQVRLVADELVRRLEASPHFTHVEYELTAEDGLRLVDFADRHKVALFSAEDERALERLDDEAAIQQRLEHVRRSLIEPEGIFLKSMLASDPLGIRELVLAKLSRASAGSNVLLTNGRIWTADHRHLLVVAEPRTAATDSLTVDTLLGFVKETCLEARSVAPNAGVHIRYAGGHRATSDNRALIKRDVSRILGFSLAAITLLVVLTFRRRILVLLSFTPVLFGALSAIAIFSLWTNSMSLLVIGAGSILVGIAFDYSVHVLYRYDHGASESPTHDGVAGRLAPVVRPLLVGALTTAAAFLGLVLSSLPGQRELGLFAALGVTGAALFALLVLPHMLPRNPGECGPSRVPLVAWNQRLLAWVGLHRGAALVGVAVVSGVAAVGATAVRFDGDLRGLNGLRPGTLADEDHVMKTWGAQTGSVSVVVGGPTTESARQANDNLLQLLRRLQAEGALSSFSSVAPLIPSQRQQAENRARWRRFWSDERVQRLQRRVTRIGTQLGFATHAFESLWDELSRIPPQIVDVNWTDGVVNRLLGQLVSVGEDETLILSRLTLAKSADYDRVARTIRTSLPEASVIYADELVQQTSRLVVRDLGRLALVAFAAVVAVLLLCFRRLRVLAAVILPLGLSVLWTFGVLGWVGIKLNLVNCLFVVFILGTAVDYTVFLAGALSRRQTSDSKEAAVTAGAVMISALTTLFGFGALVLAQHPALFSMGLTAMVGSGTGLLAAIVVVPAMLGAGTR